MASRIPPLLEAYLALPPETSLILLTGILGASTNWLVLRHLHSYLQPRSATALRAAAADGDGSAPSPEASVVLLSFLRDYKYEGVRYAS